jgi:hypothetical protein
MGKPLFNKEAWKKANNILKEILLGYYSDPPGVSFYRYQLNADGTPKVDKYGIKLIHCCCGTNDVENIHKHYHTIFRYTAGIELGDCLLAERRHRHNIRMAILRIPDHPNLGHFNTWQFDKLQILVDKNHGVLLFPSWINSTDYCDSPESFVTVAIHSEELDKALKEQAETISDEIKDSYSGDLRFLCRQLGIPIPFLPVHGKMEYKLFTTLLLHKMEHFDEKAMALLWMKHVDGDIVFPKLPHQLRMYHKKWEQNRRVQSAVKNMKSDLDMLESLNKQQLPEEMDTGSGEMELDNDELVDLLGGEMALDSGLLHYPRASILPVPQPPLQGLRPDYQSTQLCVGLERIGGHFVPGMMAPLKRLPGNRGRDARKRKDRTCRMCIGAGRQDAAACCKGRWGEGKCEY